MQYQLPSVLSEVYIRWMAVFSSIDRMSSGFSSPCGRCSPVRRWEPVVYLEGKWNQVHGY